jgi:predicted ATPase
MQVSILGPLEVATGDQVIDVGGARLRALLVRLAVDAGRPVSVAALSQALWPDRGPADPAHALQALVSRLRQTLRAKAAVGSASGGYFLDLPPDAVDAHLFERLVREGQHARRVGDAKTASTRLREALALWRGEALVDAGDAPYAVAEAARLNELRLTTIEDRIELDLATGDGHLLPELERLTAEHPLRERLRTLLVRALHADDRPAEALRAYATYRELLADELGADPGRQLEQAHMDVLRGTQVAPPRSGPQPRGNLPVPLTSFVGREQERTQVGKQLREGRLVTLVGPGGAGKSRLAATVAAGVAGDMPGGVWLVELAPVSAPDEIPQTVATTLGLREAAVQDASHGPRDLVSRLAEALPAAETLIVLDNCEHLIDAAARFVDGLLGRCPHLRIVATSREPLGILGEVLHPVHPLGLPERGMSPAEAVACPAVRLFVDRATAVRAGFAVTDDNAAAVVEICRRLDGLPLAIELAAARLRFMRVEQLAARLGDRFKLLTGGSRTALPRHRTLRAVVAWSWDLLDDDERRVAQRLAVFPASFTPEAAGHVSCPAKPVHRAFRAQTREVCGTASPEQRLDALVDRSLLQIVDGPQLRYRMLETIREYGLERLAEAGETTRIRTAHAAHFRDLAERAAPHLRGFGQRPWIRTLAAERDNLLAALRFASESGDAGTAVRLGAALSHFWTIHGDHLEAAARLRAVLEVSGDAPEEAKAVVAAGYLFNALISGNAGRASTMAERLRPLARSPEQPAAALIQAAVALITGDPAAGLAAIDSQQPHPDPWARAMLWLMRSLVDGSHSDMQAMCRDLEAAAAGFREAGERWGLATSLTYLAFAQATSGNFNAAAAALEESAGLVRELGADDFAGLTVRLRASERETRGGPASPAEKHEAAPSAQTSQRVELAMVCIHAGELDRARDELLDVVASAASARHLAMARLWLANLARYDGDLAEAARQLDLTADDHSVFDDRTFDVLFQSGMGHLAVAQGDFPAAERHLEEALTLATAMLDMPMAAVVGVGVAQLQMRRGATARAAELLGAAHGLRGAPDAMHPDVARLASELRTALGEQTYHAAYSRGRGLDRRDALTLVRGQVDRGGLGD